MDAFGRQVAAYKSGASYYGNIYDDPKYDTRARAKSQPEKASAREPSDRQMRNFAEAAYTAPKLIGDYALVPGLSSSEVLVYVDPATKQAVVTVRGTATKDDIASDVAVAAGQLHRTPRFKRTTAQVDAAVSQLGGYKVHLTGHSLGASLVNEYSKVHKTQRTVGFNTGYSIPQVRSYGRGTQDRSYTEYLNRADIVSSGATQGRYGKKYTQYYSNGRYALGAHRARPTSFRDGS